MGSGVICYGVRVLGLCVMGLGLWVLGLDLGLDFLAYT